MPLKFKLVMTYPNPIGGTGAFFVVSLPRPARVIFRLYTLRGELVWTGEQAYPLGGNYQYAWPAKNSAGAPVSYGAYYLSARAEYATQGTEQDGRWLSVIR